MHVPDGDSVPSPDTTMKMSPFDKWCYDHADEILMGIATCKKGGCEVCIKRMEIEFHIRAAGDGYHTKYSRDAISNMILMGRAYYAWMRKQHPNKSARELVGTIHDLRMKMMKKVKHD